MNYKLVAIDIDGTLLDDNHQIPPENIKTIRELHNLGVKFVIITGRQDIMAKEYAKSLTIPIPILALNGASMRDIENNKIYYLKPFPHKILKQLHNFFSTRKLYPRYYALDGAYTFNPNEFNEKLDKYAIFAKRLAQHMDFKIINTIDELLVENIQILKLMLAPEDISILPDLQNELAEIEGIEVVRGSKVGLDIMVKNVSKGNALLEYATFLGIKTEEIIAIGDSENDLSMLELVGFPITLENGEDCLKNIAKMVTSSNNDAGVSKALRKIYNM